MALLSTPIKLGATYSGNSRDVRTYPSASNALYLKPNYLAIITNNDAITPINAPSAINMGSSPTLGYVGIELTFPSAE